MLLYKSCRSLSKASRIQRQLHWHLVSSKRPPLYSLYPTLSCYSTLAIQSIPPSLDTTTVKTPSSPDWLKQTRLQLTKIQQWIDAGQYDLALQQATSLPCHDDLKLNAAMYSELVDPFASLLEQRIQQGQWTQGLDAFQQLAGMPGWGSVFGHNRRMVKAVLVMHVAQGNWSRCESILTHLHITLTATTVARMLGTLMDLNTKGSHIVWALQMFERKAKVQVNAETLGRIIGYLGDRGWMHEAYRVYNWARQPSTSPRASKAILYLTTINAAIINNDTAKAERIWHENLYRGTFNPASPPFRPATLTSYNVLLNIYASQLPTPNLARVHRTYRRLLNAGHTPSIYTYNILIKAFVNVGKPDAAYQIYDTMMHHDSRAINMLIRGWIDKREWHHVEQFIARLTTEGVQLDRRAFNMMLQGFLQLDRRRMAIDHVLKSHGDWAYWKHTQKQQPTYPLTSTELWQLLTAVTGRTRTDLDTITQPRGFAGLFEQDAFNQVSCKLFIKAFLLAKDPDSADAIKTWMDASWSPILKKKPFI